MNAKRPRQPWLPVAASALIVPLLARPVEAAGSTAKEQLASLVALAMESNPRVDAARQRFLRARAELDSVGAFFDPQLLLAGGHVQGDHGAPGATWATGLTRDAATIKAAVELPMRPGAYLSVGAAQRYLDGSGMEHGSLYQSHVGAQVRVPLVRDRVFAQWRATRDEAAAAAEAARQNLLAVTQEVRRDVELVYVRGAGAAADWEETRSSAGRMRALLAETEALIGLQVVPEYQVYTARMEVFLNEEAQRLAEHVYRAAVIRLAELVATTNQPQLTVTRATLVSWAAQETDLPALTLDAACERRGLYGLRAFLVRAAEAGRRGAAEALKPDIALTLSAAWQAEDADQPLGRDALLTEDRLASEVAVVWRQPLGYTEEKAAAAAREAETEARRGEVRLVRLQIASELAEARDAFAAARRRLELARAAVGEGRAALEAEEERFRLGQGRSRNVLDAQKDLTDAARLLNGAAVALLQARAAFAYAGGYPGDDRIAEHFEAR